MKKSNIKGFTLIELLVTISVIGFLAAIAAVGLTAYRTSGRDAKRVTDMSELLKALNLYMNSVGYYPPSAGACLVGTSGPGLALKNTQKVLSIVPLDPKWPTTAVPLANTNIAPAGTPRKVITPVSGSGFCYYYATYPTTGTPTNFTISYYMESGSGSVSQGINYKTPAK